MARAHGQDKLQAAGRILHFGHSTSKAAMAQVSPHVAAAAQSVSPPSTYHHDISRAQMQRMAEVRCPSRVQKAPSEHRSVTKKCSRCSTLALAPAVMVGAHPEELNRSVLRMCRPAQSPYGLHRGYSKHTSKDLVSPHPHKFSLLSSPRLGVASVVLRALW
eukprot:1160630-Pelagomonas_calceolata.AAC.6